MAGGRACTPGSGPGNSMKYCCSDEDYCNGTTRPIISFVATMFLLVVSMISKHDFF